MWMFGAFKLSFDVNILDDFFQKLGKILFNFLVTLDTELILAVKKLYSTGPMSSIVFYSSAFHHGIYYKPPCTFTLPLAAISYYVLTLVNILL
jgi:hypothetical protein